MSALKESGSLRTKPTFRDATTGSDVILRGIKPEVETQNIGYFVRLRIRLIVSFFFLIFVYQFSSLFPEMQALFFLPKAGMTAKTRQKRQPVWTTLIVVSHKKENLRARKRQLNSLPKDAPLHHYAGWAN